jgi:hypothetical protein
LRLTGLFNSTNYGMSEALREHAPVGSITMAATSARQVQFVGRMRF